MTVPGPTGRLVRLQRRWNLAACTITVPGGDPVFDPETGEYTDPAATTVYQGDCAVAPTGSDRVVEHGEQPVELRSYSVTLDDLTDIPVGATVTVTASPDPGQVDLELTVLDVKTSSVATLRRLTCEAGV